MKRHEKNKPLCVSVNATVILDFLLFIAEPNPKTHDEVSAGDPLSTTACPGGP